MKYRAPLISGMHYIAIGSLIYAFAYDIKFLYCLSGGLFLGMGVGEMLTGKWFDQLNE